MTVELNNLRIMESQEDGIDVVFDIPGYGGDSSRHDMNETTTSKTAATAAVDRISELGNDMLLHIISFLPSTTDVTRTSVLSKRWRHIHNIVPFTRFAVGPGPFAEDDEDEGKHKAQCHDAARRIIAGVDATLAERDDKGGDVDDLEISLVYRSPDNDKFFKLVPVGRRYYIHDHFHEGDITPSQVQSWLRFAESHVTGSFFLEVPMNATAAVELDLKEALIEKAEEEEDLDMAVAVEEVATVEEEELVEEKVVTDKGEKVVVEEISPAKEVLAEDEIAVAEKAEEEEDVGVAVEEVALEELVVEEVVADKKEEVVVEEVAPVEEVLAEEEMAAAKEEEVAVKNVVPTDEELAEQEVATEEKEETVEEEVAPAEEELAKEEVGVDEEEDEELIEFPSSSRAVAMSLTLGDADIKVPIIRFRAFHALTDFTLCHASINPYKRDDLYLARFVSSSCCPQLRSLHLSHIAGLFRLPLVNVPDTLEELQLSDLPELHRFRVYSPSLRVLRVHDCCLDYDNPNAARVSAPRLEVLDWDNLVFLACQEFIDTPAVRQLKEVHLYSHGGDETNNAAICLLKSCTAVNDLELGLTVRVETTTLAAAASVDRISKLSDDLLLLILGFLPEAKDVVQTSIVSRRWRHLWTVTPTLRFVIRVEDTAANQLVAAVDSIIARRDAITDKADVKDLEISFIYQSYYRRFHLWHSGHAVNITQANITAWLSFAERRVT
uniref:F-box domain-containing protein n=1 Tax=Leersia perrieri TaxID=77586 RepID=A0A0D9XZW2_9ORYZ